MNRNGAAIVDTIRTSTMASIVVFTDMSGSSLTYSPYPIPRVLPDETKKADVSVGPYFLINSFALSTFALSCFNCFSISYAMYMSFLII